MATRIPSLCSSCLLRKDASTCAAFPDGIPDGILLFGGDHREPVRGDDGLVWQFDPTKPEPYAEWLGVNV